MSMLVYQLVVVCMLSYVVADDGILNHAVFEQQVDDFIHSALRCHNNPGLSIAVVKDGKVILTKGYGYKNLDKKERVTENTLFGIASLTKAFTVTLLLKQLEDSQGLSLSTSLRSVLGRGDIFKSPLQSRYANIEDLLPHRIGLPNHDMLRLDDTLTRKNLIDRIKYLNVVKGGFRTSHIYNNLMYGVVTYLSEQIGGKPWEELISEKIFTPLDMTSSTFATTADPTELDLATGYREVYGELESVPFEISRHWGNLCGAGCVLSNAVDMAKWMLFNLHQEQNTSYDSVLKSDILMEAHKPHSTMPVSARADYYTKPITPVSLSESTYGLGWRNGHYRGFPMWAHSGSTFGYRALLTLLPNTNIGIFSVMTGTDPDFLLRTNLHMYVADLALGLDPWLDNITVCTFPEPWHSKSPQPDKQRPNPDLPAVRVLEEYTGTFVNPAYGTLDVYMNKTSDRLMAKIGFGQFILYPKSTSDQFYAEGFGLVKNIMDFATFTFSLDVSQTVSTLTVPSFESTDPPIFQRKTTDLSNLHSNDGQTTSISSVDTLTIVALAILSNKSVFLLQ